LPPCHPANWCAFSRVGPVCSWEPLSCSLTGALCDHRRRNKARSRMKNPIR
jgi:hypothetical protein